MAPVEVGVHLHGVEAVHLGRLVRRAPPLAEAADEAHGRRVAGHEVGVEGEDDVGLVEVVVSLEGLDQTSVPSPRGSRRG